jgi:hypothetical protein
VRRRSAADEHEAAKRPAIERGGARSYFLPCPRL